MPPKLEKPKVKVQIMVDEDLHKRIEDLAEVMQMSVSALTAKMLESAMDDNEWVIRHFVMPFVKGMDKIVGPKWRNWVGSKDQSEDNK